MYFSACCALFTLTDWLCVVAAAANLTRISPQDGLQSVSTSLWTSSSATLEAHHFWPKWCSHQATSAYWATGPIITITCICYGRYICYCHVCSRCQVHSHCQIYSARTEMNNGLYNYVEGILSTLCWYTLKNTCTLFYWLVGHRVVHEDKLLKYHDYLLRILINQDCYSNDFL